MEMEEVLAGSKRRLGQMTGLKAEAVTHVYRDELGWHVGVEMLEMSRIPPATDVIADYEVLLADDGTLLRFDRRRTRLRGDRIDDGDLLGVA